MMLGCLVMRTSETSALADPAIASAKSAAAVSSELGPARFSEWGASGRESARGTETRRRLTFPCRARRCAAVSGAVFILIVCVVIWEPCLKIRRDCDGAAWSAGLFLAPALSPFTVARQ